MTIKVRIAFIERIDGIRSTRFIKRKVAAVKGVISEAWNVRILSREELVIDLPETALWNH